MTESSSATPPTPDDVEVPPDAPSVSHAQNSEDVMLWRALGHIEGGTYIDVGAAWPELDSVTLLFYERGWSGLNVEPNPALFGELQTHRQRDINIRAAVGATAGQARFNVLNETGLSTFDNDLAAGYAEDGRPVDVIETPIITLDQLWDEHLGERSVHFLKVDVEGFETDVLAGNTWTVHRPWVVVVEATTPGSQIMTHGPWEHFLTDAEYTYVYCDGLNRFYVADEHDGLREAFRFPPNVFDGFISARHAKAEQEALANSRAMLHAEWLLGIERDQANRLLDQEREHRRNDHLALVAARIEADQARARADATIANHRWFHHVSNLKLRFRGRIRRILRRPALVVVRPAGRAARFVLRHRRLHAAANRVLARIPRTRARFLALGHRLGFVAPAPPAAQQPELSDTAMKYLHRFRQPECRRTEGAHD